MGEQEFQLIYQPMGLSTANRQFQPFALINYLNQTIDIAPFTANVAGWNGSSYIIAQTVINFGEVWAIAIPITPPSYSFIAAIAWLDTDGVWQRRKLWSRVSEVLTYPVYGGEALPADDVHFEIWSVENSPTTATLPLTWNLPISKLELPDLANDILATGTALASLCQTHSGSPSTIDDFIGTCQL